jgi:predicted RNA-binding protein
MEVGIQHAFCKSPIIEPHYVYLAVYHGVDNMHDKLIDATIGGTPL